MSEVQSRPSAPRGRGSNRGGRGGFGSRGGRGARGHATNGDNVENGQTTSIEDEGEVGQLKKQYGTKVTTIREMFPDWTDEDIVFALQETNGDLETTVERITDGTISQWGEVSKNKKDRSRSKVKESVTTTLGDSVPAQRVSRGGRGAHEGPRGGRGRGSERGRGGRGRGAAGPHVNGTRTKETLDTSIPTDESSAWDTVKKDDTTDSWDTQKPATDSWGSAAADTATAAAATAAAVTSSIIPDGVKKTWASMFKSDPVPKKEPVHVDKSSNKPVSSNEGKSLQQSLDAGGPKIDADITQNSEEGTSVQQTFEEPEVTITPSKDELTEENVEQVPDTSNPAPSLTAASTAASSWDPRSGANSSTPYSALQQNQGVIRPPTSGFAATALKATGNANRTPSYQRRLLDQEEAVRMPGNREVDRAAVQFGAFNLGEAGDDDVDGDREEPETRAQPPQHSPVAHPRAALPPAPVSTQSETQPAQQDNAALSASTHPVAAPGLPSPLAGGQNMAQQGSQGSQQFNQYGRYGQSGQDQSSFGQKPYDPFNQSSSASQNQFDAFTGQQSQSQGQQPPNAFSSAPSEYSQYYTSDQQRNNYQTYYAQQYGQQGGQTQQEGPGSQQRAFGGYNQQSDLPSAQQSQSRYGTAGETQGSGNNTPNPTAQGLQQQHGQSNQTQQNHPTQPQSQPAGQYPYGHPYSSSPYYTAYMNQFQQGYAQGNYGAGPYGGKAGIYNQPYQGYISPQAPYDHSASPAAGGFGQSSLHGRDGGLGGLGDYGRAGSQPSQSAQPLGGSGSFPGVQDAFGRSSYQGQAQQYGQQAGQQATGDDLKPFGDSKGANGPSPSLSQAARPGSAANTAAGQSALPPPQSNQQSYPAYPSHLQQQHGVHSNQASTQYGGLGGLGSHQSAGQGHQSSQYGAYSQGFGNSYYGNNQQQRGGWGNNYQH